MTTCMIEVLAAFFLGAVFGTGFVVAGCWACFRAVAKRWGASS